MLSFATFDETVLHEEEEESHFFFYAEMSLACSAAQAKKKKTEYTVQAIHARKIM